MTAGLSIPVRTIEPVPWKNGGGSTRVLANGRGWRASVADVMHDCMFSVFEGEQRHSIIVGGGGARLQHHGQQVSLMPGAVAKYPGEYAWDCHLEDGPVRILNVIHAPCMADVEVMIGTRIMLAGCDAGTRIILAVGGAARAVVDRGCERVVPDGDFLVQEGARESLLVGTDEDGAYVVAIRVGPNDQQAEHA